MSRPEPVTDYVRHLIAEWEASGKRQVDLVQAGGLKQSAVSQVKRGTLGIGPRTIAQWARAFGLTHADLIRQAEQWYRTHGAHVAAIVRGEKSLSDAQASALKTVMGLSGWATEAQVRRIMVDYAAERFRDRDAEWWVQTLLAELRIERLRNEQADRDDRQKRATHRAMQDGQAELRDARARRAARPKKGKRAAG